MATRRIESFLLRIVVSDEGCAEPLQWRGRIQHVASGAEQQIDELAQAVAFITNHLSSYSAKEFTFEPAKSTE
ncbi:MAG: hypothetical protein HGA19_03085 [Oscillochloris sp.]|nr:hypothetical protein [Oscillochloris sp.]